METLIKEISQYGNVQGYYSFKIEYRIIKIVPMIKMMISKI